MTNGYRYEMSIDNIDDFICDIVCIWPEASNGSWNEAYKCWHCTALLLTASEFRHIAVKRAHKPQPQ